MSRRYLPDDDTTLSGGYVASFALTIVMTLAAFFLANAGVFDSKPVARAGSPPRGDVVVLSNGEMAQVKSRLAAARFFGLPPSPQIQEPIARLAAKWPANLGIAR